MKQIKKKELTPAEMEKFIAVADDWESWGVGGGTWDTVTKKIRARLLYSTFRGDGRAVSLYQQVELEKIAGMLALRSRDNTGG